MLYKKRPVVIDAVKWTGYNLKEIESFLGGSHLGHSGQSQEIMIGTLEDGDVFQVKHVASKDDFIIRGVKGEFYVCKPEIFYETYEVIR